MGIQLMLHRTPLEPAATTVWRRLECALTLACRLWVYADFMINEVVITNEDQNVWRCYLAKGQYDTALQYCKDLSQREKVLTAQADHFFSASALPSHFPSPLAFLFLPHCQHRSIIAANT